MDESGKQSSIEFDPTTWKVRADGVYEDVRPIVTTTVTTINDVLKVVGNTIGLPADFLNHHLGRLRDRYRSGMEAKEVEYRQEPSFRLTCTVLKEAVYCKDEPDLQDMFADLLLSGSDNRTADSAHPGFANTITQLTPFDATLLNELSKENTMLLEDLEGYFSDRDAELPISYGNLHRLGLTDWVNKVPAPSVREDATKFFHYAVAAGDRPLSRRGSDLDAFPDAAGEMAEMLSEEIQQSHKVIGIMLTPYGKCFCKACLSTVTAEPT